MSIRLLQEHICKSKQMIERSSSIKSVEGTNENNIFSNQDYQQNLNSIYNLISQYSEEDLQEQKLKNKFENTFSNIFEDDFDNLQKDKPQFIYKILQKISQYTNYISEVKEKEFQVRDKLGEEGFKQQIQNFKLQNMSLISTMNMIKLERNGLLIQQNNEIQDCIIEMQQAYEQFFEDDQYSQTNNTLRLIQDHKAFIDLLNKYEKGKQQYEQKIINLEEKLTDLSFNIDNQLENNNRAIVQYNDKLNNIWLTKQQVNSLFETMDQVFESFIKKSEYQVLFMDNMEGIPCQERLNQLLKRLNEILNNRNFLYEENQFVNNVLNTKNNSNKIIVSAQ